LIFFFVLAGFCDVPNCYSKSILQDNNHQTDTVLADYYYARADSLNKISLYSEANIYFKKSSRLYQKSLTTTNTNIFRKYLDCTIKINQNLRVQGKFDNAIDLLNQFLEQDIGSFDNSWETYGKVYREIAKNLCFKGEFVAALRGYEKALTAFNIKLHGEKNVLVAMIYNGVGEANDDNGDLNLALAYYKRSLKILIELYGPDDARLGSVYTNLGLAYRKKGDYDRALDYLTQDLNIMLRTSPNDYFNLAVSYNNIGLVLANLKEHEKSIGYYIQSIDNIIKVFGKDSYALHALYNNLGNLYKRTDKYDEAFDMFKEAIRISSLVFGENHPRVAVGYINLGATYLENNEHGKAETSLLKGLEIDLEYYGKYHPEIAIAYTHIATLRILQNKNQEALASIQKGLHSMIYEFDNPNIYCNPPINTVYGSRQIVLNLLVEKADILCRE